jgi:tetratricopeptide (TPR) repeat protein
MALPQPRPMLDSSRVDLRACACGSRLRAVRCCELPPVAIAAPIAAQQLEPLMERFRAQPDPNAAEADETLLLAVLDLAPDHAAALMALYARRATHGPASAADALLPRFVAHHPNDIWGRCELALRSLQHGDLAGAEAQARSAVRLAPLSPQANAIMGLILLEQARGHAAEHHLRRAIELTQGTDATLLARLATAMRQQSRLEESRALFAQADAAAPGNFEILFGWARTEEAAQEFPRAAALFEQAVAAAPANLAARIGHAELLARMGDRQAALDALDALPDPSGSALMARGRVLDRLGRHEEAFSAWKDGKAAYVAAGGHTYPADEVANYLARLRGFYTAQRLRNLPRAATAAGQPQPIFIVGFPRSGTTLVEQMLCAHPLISGGDELPMIAGLTQSAPNLLASPLAYPEALAELWMGDGQEGLEVLRDQYLRGARHLRAADQSRPWFTDKMPLNETHLGLIGLLFPASPIIQLVRHPLDVVLSVFSNQLTHGFHCAATLESAALHFVRIADLVASTRAEMALRHLMLRYEDVVADAEAAMRRVSGFLGIDFDERCLRFTENRRYARTASHAQVTEQLYDRSQFRWRRYRDQLAPAIAIMEPVIARLGYGLD